VESNQTRSVGRPGAKLSVKDRGTEILRMRLEQGMSYEAIAAKFGVTKQRIEQAVNQMRDQWKCMDKGCVRC
jgi:transposase